MFTEVPAALARRVVRCCISPQCNYATTYIIVTLILNGLGLSIHFMIFLIIACLHDAMVHVLSTSVGSSPSLSDLTADRMGKTIECECYCIFFDCLFFDCSSVNKVPSL